MLVTASHQSGQDIQVYFDKEALKLISKVASHPILSNESNWKMVSIVFKHNSSGKRLVSGFKNDFTKTDNVKVKSNMVGGEKYELHQILISGTNRQPILAIPRSDINNASSMDLTLASSNSFSPSNVIWNSTYGVNNSTSLYQILPNGAIYGGDFNNDQHWAISTNCPAAYEDGEYTFVVDAVGIYGGYSFGIKSSFVTPPPYNQGGVGFTGLFAQRSYGSSIATIWVGYNNGIGPQVQWSEWNAYGTNTVVFKRETTGLNTSDFIIKVNGTEVFRTQDLYRDQPFQPAVKTMGQADQDGSIPATDGSAPGIISAQRTA